jgi:hypothetical protein
MPKEYAVDGDPGFVGVNSRDNPHTLKPGTLSLSNNFRLNRGIATVRKGNQRLFAKDLEGPSIDFKQYELDEEGEPDFDNPVIDYQARDPNTGLPLFDESGNPVLNEEGVFVYGPPGYPELDAFGEPIIVSEGLRYVTTSRTTNGEDVIIFICDSKLFTYNTSTKSRSIDVNYPSGQVVAENDPVDAFQAGGDVYILRGFSKRPLKWVAGSYAAGSVTVLPSSGHQFPNSKIGMYQDNRVIVQKGTDSISVSHYLDFTRFNALDVFRINDGSNDEIVAIAPWLLNEGVVFMKNRIYYISAGVGAYASGDSVIATDCYVKTLATDIGCVARRSITQAGGGIFFLSDFGVYFITPQQATTPEGMRAGVLGEPISAQIEDVIARINQTAVQGACATYYDNRYYLAVPLDDSTKNNAVLVYNIVNKSWESVDTFNRTESETLDMEIAFMATGIFNKKKRLFFVDRSKGLFLAEENAFGDEYENTSIEPFLPVFLPFFLSSYNFTRYPVRGIMETRSYNFQSLDDKRFTSAEVDIVCPPAGFVQIKVKTENPDVEISVDRFGSDLGGDSARDFPIRKIASSAKIRIESTNGRPTIRGCQIQAVDPGNNTISRK